MIVGTPLYEVPEGGPAELEHLGLPLDEIEDLLPSSSAYRQAARILFPQPAAFKGRPLTPLHGGHLALCAVSGVLNGVFGSGKDLHVAAWQAVKVLDRSEETEGDGTIIQRERERFTNRTDPCVQVGRNGDPTSVPTAKFAMEPPRPHAPNLSGQIHDLHQHCKSEQSNS
jgi:hypothetical protein